MSVIAISGRIGSGKDLVARIIQRISMMEMAEKGIISAQSIPSLKDISEDKPVHGSEWKIKKFAGKLKEIASMLTGIPVEKFEDQEYKKAYLGLEWDMTVREFLQKLGTEAVRDRLHVNTWVNAMFADYKSSRVKIEDEEYVDYLPKWIVSDMRFPNEFDGVKKNEGITVRIVRGHIETNDPSLHSSETSLDNHFLQGKFDCVIDNDGTIEQLELEVVKMLLNFKLI